MILNFFGKKNHLISSLYEGERLVTSFNPKKKRKIDQFIPVRHVFMKKDRFLFFSSD
jgi:hypothetical protein